MADMARALVQSFSLMEPRPGLPGEWVCTDCGAPMMMPEPPPGEAAGAASMTHADTCEGVKRLAAGAA